MPRVTKATNKKETKSTGKTAVASSTSADKDKVKKSKTTTPKATTKSTKKSS